MVIEDKIICGKCNNGYDFRLVKPDRGTVVVGKVEDMLKNVRDVHSTQHEYIIETICPECGTKNDYIKQL